MSDRPSDRAIAQAFWEWRQRAAAWRAKFPASIWVEERAREIDAAAPEGAQAVACHRTITENGAKWAWIDGPPSLGALDNLKVHPAWKIEYAYTAPPSQDTGDTLRLLVKELRGALAGVVRVADRQVDEFDRARAAIDRADHVFVNAGDSEANFVADSRDLNCPACGGSGHVDDAPPSQDAEDAVRLAVAVHNATKAYENTRGFYTSESHAAFDDQINRLKAFYAPIIEASNQRKIDAARAAEGEES